LVLLKIFVHAFNFEKERISFAQLQAEVNTAVTNLELWDNLSNVKHIPTEPGKDWKDHSLFCGGLATQEQRPIFPKT
jgi:hypothetical protein